jgi:hypothetical protein
MFFHWQNLNKKRDGTTGWGLRHGRCWWHFGTDRHDKVIQLCWDLWTHFCGVQVDWDDEDLMLLVGFPPVAFWLSFSSNWGILKRLLPRRPLEHYPDTIVVDEREIGVRIHSGCLWINPYSRKNETHSKDPWWVRGVSFSLNPFEWKHMRSEVRRPDGAWVARVDPWDLRRGAAVDASLAVRHELRSHDDPKRVTFIDTFDGREVQMHPYRYKLKNGSIQHRTAAVTVDRMVWRPRCLRWTGLIEKVRVYIDVQFSDEVGERTGSWKGGTIGCSYNLQPGETPLECLRRMERERVFA